MTEPPTRAQAMQVRVYRSERTADTYLFVQAADDLERVPRALLERLGGLAVVVEIELHPRRRLARADPRRVMECIDRDGYYLQLPPVDTAGRARVH